MYETIELTCYNIPFLDSETPTLVFSLLKPFVPNSYKKEIFNVKYELFILV